MNPNLKKMFALIKVNEPDIMDKFSDVLINGFFSLDVTKGVGSTAEASITDFPTYEGITKVDQIVLRPGALTLQGLMGNVSFGGYRGRVSVERVRALLDYLLQRAYLLTIYTEDKTYNNYVLRNLSVGRPNLGTMDVNMQLREVFVFNEVLKRIPITNSGSVITPGSADIPAENVKLIAESLKSRIISELSKLPDVGFENALYAMNTQILSLGASYGLVNVTGLSSNQIPVGYDLKAEMKKSTFDTWAYKNLVVTTGTHNKTEWFEKVTYQNYRYRTWFTKSWQIGPWDSDVNGFKVNGLQLVIKATTIDGVAEFSKLSEYTVANITNARVTKWSFECSIKKKDSGGLLKVNIPIDEGREHDNEVKARSFVTKSGSGWRFKNGHLAAGSPYGWLYQVAWITVSGQNRTLGLGLVLVHPELRKIIQEAYRETWKVQWGALA